MLPLPRQMCRGVAPTRWVAPSTEACNRERLRRTRRTNAWSLGYATLVGALFLPRDSLELDGYLEASMFDVKTDLLMFTARERFGKGRGANPWHTDGKLHEMQTRAAVAAAGSVAAQLRAGITSYRNAVASEQMRWAAAVTEAPATARQKAGNPGPTPKQVVH